MDQEKGETHEASALLSPKPPRSSPRWKLAVLVGLCLLVVVVCIGVGVGLGVGLGLKSTASSQPSNSGTYQHAAVATDAPDCSVVGVQILKKGGSAVDAAIASLLCVGTINLHSTGIGGGGFMVYYNATSGSTTVYDFREVAPGAASTYMYNNTPEDASLRGGLAVAVPGELRGLELAWRRHGALNWSELFEPAAGIAEEGFTISKPIAAAIESEGEYILSGNYSGLQQLLAPNNVLLKEGDPIKRPLYAKTLRDIGMYGADYFYSGNFTDEMVKELQEQYGSILTANDFSNYTAIEREPVMTNFSNLGLIGAPPPSSGAVLALILNILEGYNFTENDFGSLAYHRIVESFKFGYGQRILLGDPKFNETITDEILPFMLDPETAAEMRGKIDDNTTHDPSYYRFPQLFDALSPFGTSHLSVLAENGDAVAVTSTINNYFGSLIRSNTSGIIFNDEMDDFSQPGKNNSENLPPAQSNFIEPGKRPQSSMTPTIIMEGSKVKMVVGASGGAKITTAVAQVIMDVLKFSKPLDEAIPYPRLHHQLYPNEVMVEKLFPEEFIKGLEERNHDVVKTDSYAVVQGIYVDTQGIHATSDPRKEGKPDGY